MLTLDFMLLTIDQERFFLIPLEMMAKSKLEIHIYISVCS